MKIKVQKNLNGKEFFIKIPDSVNVKNLSIGEKFIVEILSKPIEVCLLADGRSLLIGNEIVRISNFKNLKPEQANIIRPVEPKVSAVKKGFGDLKSPMTGKVISIAVKNNDTVKVGDVLLIIEAMKMENRILAEGDGIIKNIKVTNGVNITAGDMLLTLESREEK